MSLSPMSSDQRRRNKSNVRRRFYHSVIQTDCYCMNAECSTPNETLQAHHIIYRSHGGPDYLWNGVTLCMRCHDRVHRGFIDPTAGRVTGHEYMITILEQWQCTSAWRWDIAYQYLLRRACIKKQSEQVNDLSDKD